MTPRILLVEDDATTRAFLVSACEALPATVDSADSAAAALELATTRDHDLWLIDANLPDGDGAGLLEALRARGLQTPALAHTAAHERDTLDALVAAGFIDALAKPMPAASLQAAIRDALGGLRPRVAETAGTMPSDAVLPVWDDAAALAALNGQRAHVDALRGLFLGELPDARDTVLGAAQAGDVEALRAALHKLLAGCGFVGAARLREAAASLQQAPESGDALTRFLAAARDTLPD